MTTNEYFDNADQTAFVKGTNAKAEDVDNKFDAITTGLDKLPTEAQLKRGTINYAGSSTGSANAYIVTLPYVPSGYVDGLEITFKANHTNTDTATIDVNSLGVKSIRDQQGTALSAGDLLSGKTYTVVYNSTSGYCEVRNLTTGTISDILTVAGISSDVTTVSGISSDVTTVSDISANVTTVAGISANVSTTAGISANITTVAGISANVTSVAGNATNINAVAAIDSDVTTVSGINADVTTVAGVSADVTTVAGISSDVTTVSTINADVTTVSGISADVTTTAGIESDITTVAGIYTEVQNVAANTIGWNFSTTTSMADPGSGIIRLNNATPASVTAIAVDDFDSLGNDVSTYVTTWADSTSTNKGTMVIRQGTSFAVYTITGLTDNTGWSQLAVTYVIGSGSFSNSTLSFVSFAKTGDAGGTANTIAALRAVSPVLNQSVQPLGYYDIGDGGGGPTRIGKTAPAGGLTDNGGSIIKPGGAVGDAIAEGELYWGWEWSGPINVKWFGGSLPNAARTGLPVYIPSGTYYENECVNPNATDSKIFFGDGTDKTIINFDDSGLANSDSLFYAPTNLEKLSIVGSAKQAIGIEVRNKNGVAGTFVGHVNISDISISGCHKALSIDSIFSSSVRRLKLHYNANGLFLTPVDNGGDSGYLTDTVFESININFNDNYAFYSAPPKKSPGVTFLNCAFQGSTIIEDYVNVFSFNLDPYNVINLYLGGDGGVVAHTLLNGNGIINGIYDNSTTGISFGTGTSVFDMSNIKPTLSSPGFVGGSSANTELIIRNSRLTNLPAYKRLELNNVTIGGEKSPNKMVSSKILSLLGDGSTNSLFTIDIGTSTSNGVLTCPFVITVLQSGLYRQVAGGTINIMWVSTGGTDVSDITMFGLIKNVTSGTLSDPTFSVSIASNIITVEVAITTDLASSTTRAIVYPGTMLGNNLPSISGL